MQTDSLGLLLNTSIGARRRRGGGEKKAKDLLPVKPFNLVDY
jgi:hypothetical protein